MKQQVEQKKWGISGSTLKIIAIVTMFIDHLGVSLIERGILSYCEETEKLVMWRQVDRMIRLVGRLAFPIFCFLLVEGFLHTRNLKKYAERLFLFAVLSEIPFNLLLTGKIVDFNYQNVFFTLFLSLLVLEGFRREEKKNMLIQLLIVGVGMVTAELLHTDYGAFGVIFPVLLYIYREKKWWRDIMGAIGISWELTAPLAFIPIHFYNGERGWKIKYFFYAFYPIHLLFLWLMREMIFGWK